MSIKCIDQTIAQLKVLEDIVLRACNNQDGYSLLPPKYEERSKGQPFGKWRYIIQKDNHTIATVELEDCDFPSINVQTVGNPFFKEDT